MNKKGSTRTTCEALRDLRAERKQERRKAKQRDPAHRCAWSEVRRGPEGAYITCHTCGRRMLIKPLEDISEEVRP